jgi:hypothetical protein
MPGAYVNLPPKGYTKAHPGGKKSLPRGAIFRWIFSIILGKIILKE